MNPQIRIYIYILYIYILFVAVWSAVVLVIVSFVSCAKSTHDTQWKLYELQVMVEGRKRQHLQTMTRTTQLLLLFLLPGGNYMNSFLVVNTILQPVSTTHSVLIWKISCNNHRIIAYV